MSELFAAITTPLLSNEALDERALALHLNYLYEGGVDGVVLCGTTGEFPSMNRDLRYQLIQKTIELNQKRLKVWAGVGANSTQQAIDFIKMAEGLGVEALLMISPWFEKTGLKAVETYYESLVQLVNVPVYLYHHPFRTHFDWPVEHIVSLAKKYPQVIKGIKDSSGDFERMRAYQKLAPQGFSVYFECPNRFKESQKLGAVGCIDGLTNLLPSEAKKAMLGDSSALEAYACVRKVLDQSANYIGLIKSSLKEIGLSVGTCFAPNQFVESAEKQEMINALKAVGRLNA